MTKQSRACFPLPPLILVFCIVSWHQFSLFFLPQVRPSLSSLLPIPAPSLFSHLRGDLNKGACRDSFFQSVMMFLVLLCFVPVALPQSTFCRFCDKAAISTYHRALRLWSLCWSPTLTCSAADLIIAGLHCSKLGNFRLPFLGSFNPRLACNEGMF